MEVDSVMPRLPPGGLFEIVFSFDTTGSMSRVIDEVKGRLQDMIQRLQADIPGIRIGVIVHGDYCDKDVFYLEQHVDLSTDVAKLCNFVENVDGTGGGDPEECYEYVLHLASTFDWTPGSQRALVVIGDATPHEPEYELNVDNLDWRKETAALAEMGVKLYGVQVFDNADSSKFFEELVTLGCGQHLKMAEFSHICDFIMAICYRERGEEFLHGYEAEVRAREARKKLHGDYENMFGVLRRGDSNASATSALQKSASITSHAGSLQKSSSNASKAGSLKTLSSSLSSIPALPSRISSLSTAHGDPAPKPSPSPPGGVAKAKAAGARKPKPIKAAVAKPTKAKRGTKTQHKSKVARHKVTEKDFILKNGNLGNRWSRWKLAIRNDKPSSIKTWERRGFSKFGMKAGWRRKTLFPTDSRSASRCLYEFAVQTKPGHKLHVMYSKWTNCCTINEKWEQRLLRRLQNVVEKLVQADCRIFVRRFSAGRLGKKQQEVVRSYKRMYTYAWSNGQTVQPNGDNKYSIVNI